LKIWVKRTKLRAIKYGEVFTREGEINAILDPIKHHGVEIGLYDTVIGTEDHLR